ncbi:MAG: polysaccharide biosynthesis tyrosine autokinase, partial [bacterium]|nr:polysaccharide biosynthesis tyrosine autokinase [bacterium]
MPQYDVTLRDYWRILRKRKVIVVFATFMLGMTSFAAALISKPDPQYKATAKVQYEKTQQSPQEAYMAALESSDGMETQQAVITSYPVVERVAHRLGRVDTSEAIDDERIKAILALRPLIQTEVEGLTNIISISITDGDRFQARDIANAVVEEYVRYNFETRNAKILKSRHFIRTQRDTIAARLRAAQEKLKGFQESTQIISVEGRTSSVLSQLNQAKATLERMETIRSSINVLLQEYRETGTLSENTLSSIPPEEGGPTLSQLNTQLQQLNQERNQILIHYTEAHPRVVDLDGRKDAVQKNMVSALRVQREILTKRANNHTVMVQDLSKEYARLPQMALEMSELQRQVQIQATMLEFYEERYQESQIAQSGEQHDVTLLQKALLPSSPTNPSTPTTTAGVGAMLGLILGVVFAFIAETLDTSIGTIEDVEEYVEVPVVGIIPQIDVEDMKEAMVRSGIPEDDTETMERRLRLASHFEPRSTLAESYRALRTNIQFSNLEKGAKVISVTSSSNQEGKSTTISNLAITLAQAGNRVLLIDGDLRRPTISRIFGLEREPGITDVILGNYAWREVIRTVTDIMVGGLGMEDIMMTPGMDNLNIITSGTIPPNPSEIIDTRRMTEFIAEVRELYDIILIDSPPVLQATDATILGTKVDGVLLVYKIGQVSRSALRRAKLQLDNVNVSVLGVVINGLRADASEDFRDLRYYSYYSYGNETEDDVGPWPLRIYRKTLRQAKSTWNEAYSYLEPTVAWSRSKIEQIRNRGEEEPDDMVIGAETVSDDMMIGAEEEPENEPGGSLLHIMLWIFLMLFLAAGILWQLDLLRLQPPPVDPVLEHPSKPIESPKKEPSSQSSLPDTVSIPTPIPAESASQKAFPKAKPSPPKRPKTVPSLTTAPTTPPQKKAHLVAHNATQHGASYTVHVASHKTRAWAERDAQSYKKKYPVQVIGVDIPGRGPFFRVLVGKFHTRQQASTVAQSLKSTGATGYAAILRLPAPPP